MAGWPIKSIRWENLGKMSRQFESRYEGANYSNKCNSMHESSRMDLNLVSPNVEPKVNKLLYDAKGGQVNGLILQIHPSFVDAHGEKKKSRFLHCSFSENNVFAVSDSSGKVFIVDLEVQKYWQIPHTGSVTEISFIPRMKSKLLIALSTNAIQIVHTETGNVLSILIGHATPVKEISYSFDGKYCLTSNAAEAIIWDLMTYTQAHKLSLKDNMSLKKALFIPVQNSIFACFQDDAMHIWKFESFECVKQIVPEGWKTHHLKSVAFTRNGRIMVIGGCTQHIAVFCLDTWTIKKIIELPDNIHSIKFMEFIQQAYDGGANKMLGIVTSSSELFFFDIESSAVLNNASPRNQLVGHFTVSPTGKYLASVQLSGEVEIYLTEKLIESSRNSPTSVQWTSLSSSINADVLPAERVANSNRNLRQKWLRQLKAVQNELKEELNLKKMLPILKQFGEYPESYRVIIWRTILQLPMNQEAYKSLMNKDCHPSYVNIESKYPLVNKALNNILKRVLSNLAYWCPLFSEVSFLPEVVFPFVKLLHCDPFICFETVATVIVNWYQNWFEFYPFPPINVLSMIENVLGYHDADLLEFYYEQNITSCVYTCLLMQTAFSEVLTKHEWLRLWDHILSNEPSFIFMAIVAYNVVSRTAIKNCETKDNVQNFFHSQQNTDVKLVISKSYHFLHKTPPDIHPRRYLSPFSPMKKGTTYTEYEAYPKLILDRNAAKLQLIQKEEQDILQEQQKTIALKKELEEKLRRDHETDFRDQVFAELDEKFREVVNAEEDRIAAQRRKLQTLRHELKLKELAVLEEVRDEILKKRNEKKAFEMEQLLKDIESSKARENEELEALEEEVQKYYSSLLLHKYRLKLDLELKEDENFKNASEELLLKRDKLKQELGELQNELTLSYRDKRIEISKKITRISGMLKKLEEALGSEKLVVEKGDFQLEKKGLSVDNLLRETEYLEKELEGVFGERVKTTGKKLCSKEKKDGPSGTVEASSDGEQSRENITYPWFYELQNDSKLKKFQLFDEEDESKLKLTDKNRSNRKREKNCKISVRNKVGPSGDGTKLHFRTKFSQCCSTPSSAFSSENKPTYSSDPESDEGELQQKLVAYKTFRKRRVRGGPKGDEQTDFQRIQSDDETRNLYETGSTSCLSDCTNELLKMALTERQKLVEEAKERHFSSV